MITLNMTPGNQIDVIWVMVIYLDNTTIYLSDADNQITLSGIPFDGKVIMHGSISELDKSINIIEGGGIGELGALSFGIARYTTNSATNDFFNEFYPATSRYVSGRIVDFGIVWQGATNLNQITWLNRYYIEDYFYNEDVIQLSHIEYDELFNKEIPYYVVQKDFDNGVSYYENAPIENYGVALPILYGEFFTFNDWINRYILAPAVCVDMEKLIYKVASHKVYYNPIGGAVYFRYLSALSTYMWLTCQGGSSYNNESGYYTVTFVNLNSPVNILQGRISVQPRIIGSNNSATSTRKVYDDDDTTYEVVNGTLSLKIEGSAGNLGTLTINDLWVQLNVEISGTIGTSIRLFYRNDDYNNGVGANSTGLTYNYIGGTPAITYYMGDDFSAKNDNSVPWTLEELFNLNYCVSTLTNTFNIYNMSITIRDINILDKRAKARPSNNEGRRKLRNYGRGR